MSKSFVDAGGNLCSRRGDGSLRVQLNFVEPTLTEQSHKDSCDINKIMERYNKTGMLPVLADKVPRYDDFSNVVTYHDALNLILDAQEAFETLPADVRLSFNNDPGSFLEAVDDPVRRKELLDSGVLTASEAYLAANQPKADVDPIKPSKASKSVPEGDISA